MYTEVHDDGRSTQEKFCVEPGTYCGLVMLFSIENAEPLVIMNDGMIQHARVAATSAVAARFLARPDSATMGILGSGGMARSHAAAVAAVRPIKRIRVFSPNREHREAFAQEMSAKLEIDVEPVERAEDAIVGADVASCCTDSTSAVLEADWLQPGMHLSCVLPHEVTLEASDRCDVIIRHLNGGPTQAAAATDDELPATLHRRREPGLAGNAELPTLAELVSGSAGGRTSPEQITYYVNVPGSAIQFAAAGSVIYEAAKARGVGRHIPTDWFLQDIRD